MQFPFVGGSYEGYSTNLNAQRSVNLYPVIGKDEGDKTPIALYGTPGAILFSNLAYSYPVRGMCVFGSNLFVVCGTKLFSVTTAGVATAVGTLESATGYCYMSTNPTQLMVVDGTTGYIWNGTTFAKITDADFPGAGTLTYQDGYFIVTKPSTGQFWISALNDGTSWDASDYTTAEAQPDNLLRIISDHRELWTFGSQTTEVYYNSGATFPFTRKIDEIIERGIIAPASAFKEDNTIFWIDDRGMARRAEGYKPTVISTRNIEYQWSTYSTIADAIGFAYVQDGHTFACWNFPTADKTWVYDASTGLWHERMSSFNYTDGRWRANCYAFFDNKHLIGDHSNGKIYQLSTTTYAEDSQPLKAIRRAPVIHDDRKYIFHHALEIEFEAGVGLNSGQGSDPQAMLKWSDDGGHTWGNEHLADIGKIGEYSQRVRWHKLGRSRNRVYEVSISDPVKRVIIGANLTATKGMS